MKKAVIAIASKGYKIKEMKTWEQIEEYQRRGWMITLVLNKSVDEVKESLRK